MTARRATLAVGLVCIAPALVGAALSVAGWLPADPTAHVGAPDLLPSQHHWLGTDVLGRDLFSRLAAAAAQFARPCVVAATVALSAGVALGSAGGLGGRGWGTLSRWLVQVLDSVPKFVFVLLTASLARSELRWIMAAVGLTFAPQIAGVIQQSVERLKASAFIEAERSVGVGVVRLVFVHILWGHARAHLLGQLTSLLGYALLVETSLSYLGGELGVQEPAASWGNMIALARDGVFRGHWLPALLPAAAISLTLFGFHLVGRGVLGALEDQT